MGEMHTPGPWQVWDASSFLGMAPVYWIGPRNFHTVAEVRPGNSDSGLPSQTSANANLIAAAPDLLEALRTLRDQIEFDANRDGGEYGSALGPIMLKVDVAIDKAAGA